MRFETMNTIQKGSPEEAFLFNARGWYWDNGKLMLKGRRPTELEPEFYLNCENHPTMFFIFCHADGKDNAIMGMLNYRMFYDEVDIIDVHVVPRYRRRGVFTAMLQYICKHPRECLQPNRDKELAPKYSFHARIEFDDRARYHHWKPRLEHFHERFGCRMYYFYHIKYGKTPKPELPGEARLKTITNNLDDLTLQERVFLKEGLDYLTERGFTKITESEFEKEDQLLFYYGGVNNEEVLGVITSQTGDQFRFVTIAYVAEKARNQGILTFLSKTAAAMFKEHIPAQSIGYGVDVRNKPMRRIMEERRNGTIYLCIIGLQVPQAWMQTEPALQLRQDAVSETDDNGMEEQV